MANWRGAFSRSLILEVHLVRTAGPVQRGAQVLAFFSRLPPCLVGLEACATAHYWARELRALGHEVRLMPAQYVKAYIKRNKNDAADAEAICEAIGRPTMRFVPVKTADQQAAMLLHRGRERLVRQRTGLVNALRGHLAEFGVIAPQGLRNVGELIAGKSGLRLSRIRLDGVRPVRVGGWGPGSNRRPMDYDAEGASP